MRQIEIYKADDRHDAELRRFMHEGAWDASQSLRLEREPKYFDALQVEGVTVDVIAAHDGEKIVGVATRSEKPCFVDGAAEPVPVGYLSNVKIAPAYRKSSLVLQGCRFLAELHRSSACEFYLMCILTDNKKVIRFLQNTPNFSFVASTGEDIPQFVPLGLYRTYLLFGSGRGNNPDSVTDIIVRRARRDDIPGIINFIRHHGPRRQFFPCYTADDLSNSCGLLKGLAVSDIFLACKGERLVGTLGVWDQTHFRQWYINDYTRYRTMYEHCKDICTEPSPRLPRFDFSSPLDCRMLALVCIAEDSPAVFAALLNEIKRSFATEGSMPYLWIGLHEEDPLNVSIQGMPYFLIQSALYLVSWGNATCDIRGLQKRIPYLELGSL